MAPSSWWDRSLYKTRGDSNVIDPVRHQLDGYGFTARVGADAYYETAGSALEQFEHRARLRPDEQSAKPRDEPPDADATAG
jgi:hypothetical protein